MKRRWIYVFFSASCRERFAMGCVDLMVETLRPQNPPPAMACRFESGHRHQRQCRLPEYGGRRCFFICCAKANVSVLPFVCSAAQVFDLGGFSFIRLLYNLQTDAFHLQYITLDAENTALVADGLRKNRKNLPMQTIQPTVGRMCGAID